MQVLILSQTPATFHFAMPFLPSMFLLFFFLLSLCLLSSPFFSSPFHLTNSCFSKTKLTWLLRTAGTTTQYTWSGAADVWTLCADAQVLRALRLEWTAQDHALLPAHIQDSIFWYERGRERGERGERGERVGRVGRVGESRGE